jgi:hypothetical protein
MQDLPIMGQRARARAAPLAATTLVIFLGAGNVAADDQCPPKLFRWEEDCSSLREATGALGAIDRFRYIPLSDSGSVWLTLGGEYRFRTDYIDALDWGLKHDVQYTAYGQRAFAHADLRTAEGFRVFLQLSAATEDGREPFYYPFDRSRPDIAQAFIDMRVFDSSVLRVGRQEIDSGGNRLISVREAGNLRLAFDMAHLESQIAGFDGVAFYGRPVLNQSGAFDDDSNRAERFWGGWIQRRWGAQLAPLVNVFYFARDRDRAVYQQGVARDERRTIGMRLSGRDTSWDYAVQGAYQYGKFGTADISAEGFAGDVGWHPALPGHPRIGASFGYASGDANPKDRTLGTFDVLYPNLGYFTDAPVYYPGNTADVQPNVTFSVLPGLQLRGGADVIYRVSKHDAIYTPPGVPLVPGTGAGPHYATTLTYLRTDWFISPRTSATLSYVYGDAGSLIRSSGGRPFNYLGFWLDLRL